MPRGALVARHVGEEVSGDADILKKLKEWKKTKGQGGGKPKGFAVVDEAPAAPAPAAATTATAPAKPKAETKPLEPPADVPKPISRAAMKPVEPEPSGPPLPRANDAIFELMKRTQEEDVSPAEFTVQQLLSVFFTFFAGWRKRYDIPGDIELTDKQKQIIVLMVHTHLTSVRAAKDFWPSFCAELGAGRDQEVKELVFALTGLPQ